MFCFIDDVQKESSALLWEIYCNIWRNWRWQVQESWSIALVKLRSNYPRHYWVMLPCLKNEQYFLIKLYFSSYLGVVHNDLGPYCASLFDEASPKFFKLSLQHFFTVYFHCSLILIHLVFWHVFWYFISLKRKWYHSIQRKSIL